MSDNKKINLNELFNKKEELHPALALYRCEIGIRHPLVYSVPHNDLLNAMINKMLEVKMRATTEALNAKNWSSYIWLHERPWRLSAFNKIKKHLDNKTYWMLLRDIYQDSENIFQNLKLWIKCLNSRRSLDEHFMSEAERNKLNSEIPYEITIYRGCTDRSKYGLSYSLSKEKAEWFRDRWWRKNGILIERKINTDMVFAYLEDRQEEEIIILPKYIKY